MRAWVTRNAFGNARSLSFLNIEAENMSRDIHPLDPRCCASLWPRRGIFRRRVHESNLEYSISTATLSSMNQPGTPRIGPARQLSKGKCMPRPSSYPLLGPKYLLLGTIYPQLRVQGGSWWALILAFGEG